MRLVKWHEKGEWRLVQALFNKYFSPPPVCCDILCPELTSDRGNYFICVHVMHSSSHSVKIISMLKKVEVSKNGKTQVLVSNLAKVVIENIDVSYTFCEIF